MTLSKEQLNELKFNYCEQIIDDMDMDSLVQCAHDLLMDAYANCSEEEMQKEVEDLYSEDKWEDLLESITN